MGRRKISALKSPYYSNLVGDGTFTVGAEGSNIINVAFQAKDTSNNSLASRSGLRAWFSEDSAGATPLRNFLMPNGGYAIGTNGGLIKGHPSQDALLVKGTLTIDAVPEKFKTTTTATFRIAGANLTKAAATAIVFSAAHVVTASKFAVILIQVDKAGTVTTKVPLATQAYATAALALAAIPSPDAGNTPLGYIQIAAKAATWTANTDDMTNGSDLTTAAFVDATESGLYPTDMMLLLNATGQVDLNITETGVRNPFYLNVLLPDGTVKSSGVIQFA